MTTSDLGRATIEAAIRSTEPSHLDIPDDCVLTAWVVVGEWMAPSGERYLSRDFSEDLTPWQADGMLNHAQGDWAEEEEE